MDTRSNRLALYIDRVFVVAHKGRSPKHDLGAALLVGSPRPYARQGKSSWYRLSCDEIAQHTSYDALYKLQAPALIRRSLARNGLQAAQVSRDTKIGYAVSP